MYCECCECPSCEAARDREDRLAELKTRCEAWNWNAHPLEVAREVQDLVDNDGYDEDEVFGFIGEFFDEKARREVEDLYHLL